jgi:hypothetical protein
LIADGQPINYCSSLAIELTRTATTISNLPCDIYPDRELRGNAMPFQQAPGVPLLFVWLLSPYTLSFGGNPAGLWLMPEG